MFALIVKYHVIMRSFLLSILLLITSYSCTNPKSSDFQSKIVNFGNIKAYKTSDLISEIDFVKLETNSSSHFGKIDQIMIYNNKIYILDSYPGPPSVFVFSIDGKFINKIMNVGNGPGEYLSADCFGIDKNKGLILLLDRQSNTIVRYRIGDLSFVDKLKIQTPTPASFIYNPAENLYYYYYSLKDNNNKHIEITTEKGATVNKLIDPEPSGRIVHGCQCNFYHFEDNICVFPYFSNKIYTVNKDTAYVKYELLFGDNKMPDQDLFTNNSSSGAIMKEMMSGDEGRIRMLVPYELADQILVKYYIKKDVFIGAWHKSKSQSINFKYSDLTDDMGIGGKFPLPIGVFKDKFIGALNTYDIDTSCVKNAQLKLHIKNTSDSDNPILVLFK